MKTILTLILILSCSNAFPCSLGAMTEPFAVDKSLNHVTPIKPSFKVSRLSRGTKSGTSCSGLASLRLIPTTPPLHEQGYIFEVIEGVFDIFHVAGPITTTETHRLLSGKFKTLDKNEFLFYYFEAVITPKPIDITLKITAVSKSGAKSDPQLLKIQHDGAKLLKNDAKVEAQ